MSTRKATLHSSTMVDVRYGIVLVLLALATGLATIFTFRAVYLHDPPTMTG